MFRVFEVIKSLNPLTLTLTLYMFLNKYFKYNLAGWQLAFSIMTILFAVVIGTYGPYVFGKQALVNGMSVATDFWEFFLPVKYAGRPVDEKVVHFCRHV